MLNYRIIKAVLISLIVITLIEISYYIYINFNQNPTPISNSLKPEVRNQGINNIALTSLRNINSDILTSSVLTNTYEGIIVDIVSNEGILPTVNFQYKLKLTLKGYNLTNTFYYNEKDLSILKVVEQYGGTEKPIQINNLKINDKIIIKEIIDLIKDFESNLTELKITKI